MTGKRERGREGEIEALATELDALLDELAGSVEAINAILKRPKQPPEGNVKVVSRD
jgi:hypothetical protein